MDDYKSLQDVVSDIDIRYFYKESFRTTKSPFSGLKKRKVELYTDGSVKVLIFSHSFEGNGECFVQFEKDLSYKELSGGLSRSQGWDRKYNLKNPWDKYVFDVTIYTNKDQALISYGISHNFLRRVEDASLVENELSSFYYELPKSVRSIDYMCHINNGKDVLCIDSPFYRFSYKNMRSRIVHNTGKVEDLEILSFSRYRDGGTTNVKLKDSQGAEHHFFYPNQLGEDLETQVPTYDGEDITRSVPDNIRDATISMLGIILDPHRNL